ncbi:MAG: hypothetical protein PHC28_01385 [Flavobacterium sp.]|uniref:hypothetical protein n=1 Tax=Flavobacterium sp. TaxID=239 RepID=UPI00260D0939|nr:hypothetical protein [Flavobacterium sp.]MDD5149120.1 hypothetical protein [Flavobacterium sp.]
MKYVAIAFVLIVAGFVVALQFIPIGIEPLTEMYFENHTELPAYLFLNQTYNFSFSIHNLEYIDMDYNYSIALGYNNKTYVLEKNNVTIKNNETTTIFQEFAILENFERGVIDITLDKNFENPMQKDPNLINRSIDIHFWFEEITGPTIIVTSD